MGALGVGHRVLAELRGSAHTELQQWKRAEAASSEQERGRPLSGQSRRPPGGALAATCIRGLSWSRNGWHIPTSHASALAGTAPPDL